MDTTIGDLAAKYHLDRGTLLKAAKVSHLLGRIARKSGQIWLIDDESDQFQGWLKRHRARGTMEEQQQPTILEQTQDIRQRYQRGDITPEQAKQLIRPYYDEYVKLAKEKAEAAGMKAPIMSLQKFLSRRSDLRYVAQQHATEQREQS